MIDSLDQLTDEDGARRFLEWLPRKLPAHVHMMISTLPEEGGCMQRLKTFGIPAGQFLQVNEIGKSVVTTVVKGKTLFQVNYANYRGFFLFFFISKTLCPNTQFICQPG